MANEIVLGTQQNIKTALKSPETIEQFVNILGGQDEAKRYMGSVFLAVSASEDLQKCSQESIIRQALRCAAMRLSCDPEAKQGQLVPRWNGKKQCQEATLIVHYKGQYNQAMRTGLYRNVNVSECYKGYEIEQDLLTGLHTPKFNKSEFDPNIVTGYLGYFETKDGTKKTVWWPIERINKHIATYAPKNPLYNDPKTSKAMKEKIVWRDLLSWTDKHDGGRAGYVSPDENPLFDDDGPDLAALSEHDVIDGEATEAESPATEPEEISEAEALFIQACEVVAGDGEKYAKKSDDFLKKVISSQEAPDEKKRAAKVIIDWRKAKESKIQSELYG